MSQLEVDDKKDAAELLREQAEARRRSTVPGLMSIPEDKDEGLSFQEDVGNA
jgi:hypothetical protein